MKPLSNQTASLARIEQKLDDVKEALQGHIETFDTHLIADKADFKAIHDSIDRLHRWQSWVVGIGSGIAFALGALELRNLL